MTDDLSFEWPKVTDLINFKTGQSLKLSGIRYIANRNHIKAIGSKLSNGAEGSLIQSPRNHSQQLLSFKEVYPENVIRKVEVIYQEDVADMA